MNERRFLLTSGMLFATVLSSIAVGDEPRDRRNVLFIAVDDLRPALGCYGDPVAITPNIDRLAGRGRVFRQAFCQQAVCSPSRLSLLTGRRPDTIRVWDLATHFRDAVPDVVTLPQQFKANGYETGSIGKIYHGSGAPSKDPPSWSVTPRHDYVRDASVRYASTANRMGKGLKRAASESAEVGDEVYIDGIVADEAIAALREWSLGSSPFFLAVGFRKPHLPFCAPKKYWDLYDPSKITLPVPSDHPADAPEWAVRSWKELEGYSDIPKDGALTKDQVRRLRHGYYACVSYVDALVGRLLNELDRSNLAGNTVVVLWGDHGFHLGEQGLWTKANNYEWSTRVPLIFAVPEQARPGEPTDAIVELVDVFPTLVDLCDLPPTRGVEGISLKPLVSDPNRAGKIAALSQFPRTLKGNRHRGRGDVMGYAVRTNDFRYVQWRSWKSGEIVARELYDRRHDPQESANVVSDAAYADVELTLAKMVDDGWQFADDRKKRFRGAVTR